MSREATYMYNFISCILNGTATIQDINKWVEFWFEGGVSYSLREHLGFTREEYAEWCTKGDEVLEKIVRNHKTKELVLN